VGRLQEFGIKTTVHLKLVKLIIAVEKQLMILNLLVKSES